ncbi:helicase-related protein [Altererythrobacter sp. CAU 1778]
MENEPFDAGAALAQLKRFQRRTVDYVFDRLHGADPVRQFLVADEVGLGKTMVARGVIAKTIEALWNRSKRIDILYICSNQAIAAQNLNRLNVLGKRAMALPTRMTLVPLQLRGEQDLSANKVNFISLTPGTTFNLRSTTGVVEERALLHRLLEAMGFSFTPLRNALQVDAGNGRWDACVGSMSLEGIDPTIVSNFHDAVRQDASLLSAIDEMISLFPRRQPTYPDEKRWKRNEVIGALRSKLSHACVSALKPDLIILDEFQRFRELLRGEGEPAELARALFEYSDDTASARTLLLSATPYKMLTLSGDEPDDGDHYEDFLETIEFLYGRDKGATIKVELDREMRRFRKLLQQLPSSATDAKRARNKVQRTLKRVMARTERVGSTAERDSMLAEPSINVPLAPADLHQAEAFARVARAVDAREIIEYWKSAPYLLNFMRDYTLKHRLKDKAANSNPALISALRDAQALGISREQVEAYQPIDPANGRLRALMADLFDSGLHQHLWLPPAVTYYGRASEGTPATKALVFSAWQMVPDALAALLSYEAERRMGAASVVRSYSEATRRRPLQFKLVDGRPAAMRALHLIYPSPTLARICDPLSVFSGAPEQLSVAEMRAAIADRIRTALGHLFAKENGEEAAGRDAEWSTPATIDVLLKTKSSGWLQYLGYRWTIQEEGFREHIAELRRTATEASLGKLDNDTLDLLVDVALGSPAVCALRALHRIAPGLAWDDPHLMDAAASIAWGFRALFNQHDAVALLRQERDDHYWRSALTHGVEHNLQSVLDEYAHYLVEGEGLVGSSERERVAGVAAAMTHALSVRPSQIDVDDVGVEDGKVVFHPSIRMRGRFAMRLAEYKDDEGGTVRLGSVRDAFNSPFRPFVLATTSIGQEGLDFHPYCYRVYHWNLPGNPVDLEQREGRVHRFKGHAVRHNVARAHADAIRTSTKPPADPWEAMFNAAKRATTSKSELVPYWVFDGPVKVERRVPMLPMSRENTRLRWLKRSLTLYRLAFGQPRQDDLLAYLNRLVDEGVDVAALEELQIKLEP